MVIRSLANELAFATNRVPGRDWTWPEADRGSVKGHGDGLRFNRVRL